MERASNHNRYGAPTTPVTTPTGSSVGANARRATRSESSTSRAPTSADDPTASGLPVGVGVIAVDPTVIPLGTRLFVPGYGPGVAADVGAAIKGNIIDLWMPSTAAARAWGRRTVTITIYG